MPWNSCVSRKTASAPPQSRAYGRCSTPARRGHAVGAAAHTQSGRVRQQLAQLYPYTVGRDVPGPLREARDHIRELLAT
ncbi:hypothetical protein [Streptomyces sp. NPDC059008]|uniref:hypothetical protein n=1 Tax=Streptomyces sp. NPDC059008 TaxID=3346693 RepID=UPI0036766C95